MEMGLMTEAGFFSIQTAKENGSWTVLDQVEELFIPKDLAEALAEYEGTSEYFESLSKSSKKQILYWVTFAKRPETRQKRVKEVVEYARQRQKPPQFR